MKLLKTCFLCLFLALCACPAQLPAASPAGIYNTMPDRTVVIKHPAAANVNTFFSSGTLFNFEVYKAGSKVEINKMLEDLKNDPAVESVTLGALTGDYQAFTLVLKAPKNKAWFVSAFEKAGLNTIKVNNNAPVAVNKL